VIVLNRCAPKRHWPHAQIDPFYRCRQQDRRCGCLLAWVILTEIFAGHVPLSIVTCKKLQTLNIFGNNITGRIPAGVKDLPMLMELSVFSETGLDWYEPGAPGKANTDKSIHRPKEENASVLDYCRIC
jgi:hypothetical protein